MKLKCLRVAFILCNVFVFLFGAALVVIGTLADRSLLHEKIFNNSKLISLTIASVVIGGLVALIAVVGFWGVSLSHTTVLKVYATCVGISIVVEVAFALAVIWVRHEVELKRRKAVMNYIEEHYKRQNSTDNPRMHDQKNATMLNGENSGPKKHKTIPYIVMVGVLEYLGVITKRIDYLTDIIVALAFASLLPFILGLLFGIRLIIRIRELTEAN